MKKPLSQFNVSRIKNNNFTLALTIILSLVVGEANAQQEEVAVESPAQFTAETAGARPPSTRPPGRKPPPTNPPPRNPPPTNPPTPPSTPEPNTLDDSLTAIITQFNLDRSPTNNRVLPSIDSPLAQLGKKLFFSKSLGGDKTTACASCHYPTIGGADQLSFPIGVAAVDENLLGQGRENVANQPVVPRNSPTIFNVALWDNGLFWDSCIESLGKERGQNGAASGISTPDSGFGNADVNAGNNLVTAQARFPVVSNNEMRTNNFEQDSNNEQVRHHLAARIGDYDEGAGELFLNAWLSAFQTAFSSGDDATTLVTFNNIALAIGEYQRSMVFVQSPWRNYVEGDLTALSDTQKEGALLFFAPPPGGGAGCASCHGGPIFSDGQHHTVGFPQFGEGTGDGLTSTDDFGRERVTGDSDDRYRFRTPSLLNISVTAPYGHTGAYGSLAQVLRHYDNPRRTSQNYVQRAQWCDLPQFASIANCQQLYPDAQANTLLALNKLQQEQNNRTSTLAGIRLNGNERAQLVEFLTSLTDPCVESRACLLPWIANEADDNPDGNVLIGLDINGQEL